jgi:hypothetical protein
MARQKLPIPKETIQASIDAARKAGFAVVEIDLGNGRKMTFHKDGAPKGDRSNEWDDAFDGNDPPEVR